MTPRVLHVLAALNRGGAETWLMDVVRTASRDSLEIDVCVTGDDVGVFEEEFAQLGGTVLRCPLGRNPWSFCRRFERMLPEREYDVVHSHLYYFSGMVLRAAARAGVAKRIAHNHPVEDVKRSTLQRRLYRWWMRGLMCRYGTAFVGPTRASLQSFWGDGWESDPTKSVIYNGIDVGRFAKPIDPVEVRRELGIPEAARIVLNVARFAPHKRHEFLIDVAAEVIAKRDDAYFLLIGKGPLKGTVENLVLAKGLTDRVLFIGGLPNIDRFWISADAFAFPSCNEGFGVVVVEAAAAGLPVIAQDIPGVREAATASESATLLPLDTNATDWAESLLEALNRDQMSEEQRQTRLREFRFTIGASVDALKTLYTT